MIETIQDPRVELRLLGGFELRVDGVPIDVTPAVQRLLAFIALNPRGADRCFTAFQLWPEHDERRAKANLRSALWRLGKVEATLVVATSCQLRLAPSVWVDLRDGIAESASSGLDHLVQAVLPLQSLDSDLLPGWYDDWLMIERERLRQFQLGTLEDEAKRQMGRGDCTRAVQLGLAAVAIEPLRESGHRIVIDAHLAQGNRCEARRQFECYRSLLAAQMGWEPSADLAALVETPLPRLGPERADRLLIAV